MPGRGVFSGVWDLSANRLRDQSEWDRITATIAEGWKKLGFLPHRHNVYLMSPNSLALEEQQVQLRREFAELGASWAATART